MEVTPVVIALDENCNVRECINCDPEQVRIAVEMCRKGTGHVAGVY